MAHPNEDLLRRGYAAFAAADMDTVFAMVADDIVWHAGGSNPLSGTYRGLQEFMGFLGKLVELTGGTFRQDIHDILANDTHGVVLATVHVERDGVQKSVREAQIWHIADGKAKEFWAFPEESGQLDDMLS